VTRMPVAVLVLGLAHAGPLAAAEQKKGGGDVPTITSKDVDQVMKFWTAALAVIKSDPALRKRLAEESKKDEREGEGPDRLRDVVVREPKLKKALADAGIKPERFGPVTTTVFLAAGVVDLKRTGQLKEYPAEIKAAAQIMEKRPADVEKLSAVMKEMETLTNPGGE
jgi:hypothetical protein